MPRAQPAKNPLRAAERTSFAIQGVHPLAGGFRLDVLVADRVVVEVKTVESILPIHQAQMLTYMKMGGWKVGLLINFNVPILKKGIKRLVLGFEEP